MLRKLAVLAYASIVTYAASLDVPFVRQYKQGCGPAAVAMLLQYWAKHGVAVSYQASDPAAIYYALYDPDVHGTFGSAMAGYLRSRSFQVFAVDGAWPDLETNIARGRPVIVCIRPTPRSPLHFVVVVGLSDKERKIVVHDPARGAYRKLNNSDFEQAWRATGHWTLISAPEKMP